MENQKLFDEWNEVNECTNCESWWTSQCDGTPEGSERPCKAFKATRKVKIPEDIEALKNNVRALENRLVLTQTSVILTTVALIIHIIIDTWVIG